MTEPSIPSNVPPVLSPPPVVFLPADFAPPPAKPRKSHLVSYMLSWMGIVAVLFFHAALSMLQPAESRPEATKVDLMQVNMMGKIAVGSRTLSQSARDPWNLQSAGEVALEEFSEDDYPEAHWCQAILLNETRGAGAALSHLEDIDRSLDQYRIALTPDQQRISDILRRLFTSYERGGESGGGISGDDKQFLQERLGWSGKLALTPKQAQDSSSRHSLEQGARVFVLVAGVIGLLFALALFCGFAGFMVFAIFAFLGKLRFRLPAPSGSGHIYGETFAIWFVLFTVLQVAAGFTVSEEYQLMAAGVAFFASLSALFWPVVRGIPWRQVRQDIGWKRANPFVEAICGVAAYVSLLPLLALAIFVMVVLSQFVAPLGIGGIGQLDGKNAPTHPIVFEFAKNDPSILFTGLILACLAAPLIEETMFRGVLYRHLRDSTVWFRRFVSVFLSAGLNSLIFAAIHPQGLLGIPVLGTLAFGFSLVREWRDSLIASMVMHALNNGTMLGMLILALRSL